MTEYSGERICSATKSATGRLCRHTGCCDSASGAYILLFGDGCILKDELPLGLSGLVFESEACGDNALRAQKLAELYKIPALRLDAKSKISADLEKKIAILDPERGKLFVDPSIEIINEYFESPVLHSARISQVLALNDSPERPISDDFCGVVIEKEKLCGLGENAIYEYLCDLADKHTGLRLVAELDFSCPQSFEEGVRAVYRAGVWGRFSLVCSGIATPARTKDCVSVLHAAFCALDSSGREFNGFIPKGISIDSPLLLLEKPMHRIIDFFVLDYFSLSKKFAEQCGVYDTLTDIAVDFIRNCGGARIALRSSSPLPEPLFSKLCQGGAVSELYLTENSAKEMRAFF